MDEQRKRAIRATARSEDRPLINVLIGIEEQLERIASLLEPTGPVEEQHVAYYEAIPTPDPAHPGYNLYVPGTLIRAGAHDTGAGRYPDRYFKADFDALDQVIHPGRYVGPETTKLFDQDASDAAPDPIERH